MAELLMAVAGQDPEHLTAIITRVGSTPPDLDRTALCLDLADFVSHYGGLSLDRFDLSGALREITEMVRRYGIILPARVAMLIKTFVSLEGTSRMLAPSFSLIEVMRPYRKRVLWQRLSPGRRLRKLRRFLGDLEHMISVLPREIIELLDQIQTGKFDVHLDHRGLEPSVNRLVLGMLASALFLGSSLLLARQVSPTFDFLLLGMKDISALGAAGAVGSFFLGWRVLRAINRSGRLDRR
jgi:ubiquinone biosynthesis protein